MNEQHPEQEFAPTLNFDDFCTLIAPLGAINSPSELHGLLSGKLSGGAELTETRWLLDAVEFLDFTQAPTKKFAKHSPVFITKPCNNCAMVLV